MTATIRPISFLILAALLALSSAFANAATVIIPPGNASVEGSGSLGRPLSEDPETTQFVYDDSLLSGIPGGSFITGMHYRLTQSETAPGPAADQTWTSYDVVLSQSNFGPGSLSTTFAANIGPDAVTVRSGPFTVFANSYPAGGPPRPFGPLISFSTPYLYLGGNDLLITLRHTGHGGTDHLSIDAQEDPATMQNIFADGYTATTATDDFEGAAVLQLQFTPAAVIPEPSTWLLMGLGLIILGVYSSRRRV